VTGARRGDGPGYRRAGQAGLVGPGGVSRRAGASGPLHLYAEELDAVSGQHLGNYPQAFTHLALIDAVTQLIELETGQAAPGPGGPGGAG